MEMKIYTEKTKLEVRCFINIIIPEEYFDICFHTLVEANWNNYVVTIFLVKDENGATLARVLVCGMPKLKLKRRTFV